MEQGLDTAMKRAPSDLPALLWFLPGFVKRRIVNRPNLIKILDNIGWLFFDKILRMGVGLIVGVWVARYLGPEQYGLLNYANAFVGMFGALSMLGLGNIIVKDLIVEEDKTGEILGSAFLLQAASGILSLILIAITILLLDSASKASVIVLITSLALIFKPFDVIKYWFEAKVESRFTAISENIAFFLSTLLKIYLIISAKSLVLFAATQVFEAIVATTILFKFFKKKIKPSMIIIFNLQRSKNNLKVCVPILISSLCVSINMNIDKILLKYLASPEELGFYSSSSNLVSAWFFVPLIIGASISPYLTEKYCSEINSYQRIVKKIYLLIIAISLLSACAIFIFSHSISNFLYGPGFAETGFILKVNIWSIIFISIVSIRGRLLTIEGKFLNMTIMAFWSMLLNFIFCTIFIPNFGAAGAAFSSSTSWFINAVIFTRLFSNHSTSFKTF